MRARILAVLILLGSSVYLIGQSAAPSPAADDTPKLVVALFRHGIRSLTPSFAKDADKHSRDKWPALADWKVMVPPPGDPPDCDPGKGWGYLTIHGQKVAQTLGAYYGAYYKQGAWANGFKIYLWADGGNQRTRETANALAVGLKNASSPGNPVTVAFIPACASDPLFHPFKSLCGAPNGDELTHFAAEINKKWQQWAETSYQSEFGQLYNVLSCFKAGQCSPLSAVTAKADACVATDCGSPLQWSGLFSYASSASEGFLLEYANGMDVGWGRVDPPKTAAAEKLQGMLKLHEFYFDKTDRFLGDDKQANQVLAGIEGSNLIREILDQLNRKAGRPTLGLCPRANADSDFVGLVGHDTNLAGVGALLGDLSGSSTTKTSQPTPSVFPRMMPCPRARLSSNFDSGAMPVTSCGLSMSPKA
jgi:hypothetical protein